jgi:peptide/nickel transport system permease protein
MIDQSLWRRFLRNRAAVAGFCFLLVVVAMGVVGPALHPRGALTMAGRPFLWPAQNPRFPLGTDNLGRDVLSGLIEGARISLWIGITASVTTILVGVVVGAASGSGTAGLDELLMHLTEVFQTIPNLLFAILIVTILKPTLGHIVFAISAVSWPAVARIVRAEMLSLRGRDFVASCRMIGMGRMRIVLTQLLPNCLSSVIVMASMLVATSILAEAALSFLNLSDSNVMSWGRMIGNGRSSLRDAWYLVAIPGCAIMLTVLALSLVGAGVNDALNPRLRDG